jgi:hypothetical protein
LYSHPFDLWPLFTLAALATYIHPAPDLQKKNMEKKMKEKNKKNKSKVK